LKIIALLLAIAGLAGCSTLVLTSDWDPDVDFSQFQTFAILDDGTPGISRLVDARIRIAIIADLTSKGLRQEGVPDLADLAVGYQVATEERRAYRTLHDGWGTNGFRSYNSSWGSVTGTGRSVPSTYTIGTLVVAMFQMTDKQLVFEAAGNRRVTQGSGAEAKAQQRMNEDVQQLMRDFPPGR
jgi:hypothetical protein